MAGERNRKRTRLSVAGALVLAACNGGSSTAPVPAPSPTPSPTPSPSPTPTDTIRPVAPASLTVVSFAYNRVELSWPAGSDDAGPVRYVIMRSDKDDPIAVVSTLGYTDLTVAPVKTYTYRVFAIDGANNRSPTSASTLVTTLSAPTSTCPEVTTDYPGPGGTGLDTGFQADESRLLPVGPDNVPDGMRWDAAARKLIVFEPHVHLNNVIIRGDVEVTAGGVFALTNSVVEFQPGGRGFICRGELLRGFVSECRLTGNTFRRASGTTGVGLFSYISGQLAPRCNRVIGMSIRISEQFGRTTPLVEYNWVDEVIGFDRTQGLARHNRAGGFNQSQPLGSNLPVDAIGNFFGGATQDPSIYLSRGMRRFNNNVIAPPAGGGRLCWTPPLAFQEVAEAIGNVVGNANGMRTSTPFNYPGSCSTS